MELWPDLCLSAPGLCVCELWVFVLRQNQFQFASTLHCGVNNGGLVANMQVVMDRNHSVMAGCNKVPLLLFTLGFIFFKEAGRVRMREREVRGAFSPRLQRPLWPLCGAESCM